MKTYHVALLVIILLLSLLVRLYFVQNGEFLPLKDYDGRTYDGLARQLLAGKGFGNEGAKAFVTPGYPLFLSLIYRLTGTGEERIFVIRLVQAVLGTVTVLIVYGLGNKLGSPATGLLAAALAGIY
ncbi:glycosyltransferase family 39 protein, partial [Calderihabitans maritimus]